MSHKAHTEMSKNLITINADETLHAAFRRMQENEIRHLPVVNNSNELVGILSDRDLARALRMEVEVSRSVPVTSYQFPKGLLVRDFMSTPVRTVHRNTDIKIIADTMIREKISCVLVAGQGDRALDGIVTSEDLLKLLSRLLTEKEPSSKIWNLDDLADEGWISMTHQ